MPNGEQWEVPAEMIIVKRAEYYATHDSNGEEKTYLKVYDEEYKNAFNDNDLIIDWARNNFNWKDVELYAYKVAPPPQLTSKQKEEAWMNGKMEVVNKV
jgi:hypothetical protein